MNLGPNPTTQEAYEYIRTYFLRPDARLAKSSSGFCRYRAEDGAKCAVGCMISDELYFTVIDQDAEGIDYTLGDHIEGNSVDEIAGDAFLEKLLDGPSEEGQRKLDFLKAAQRLHDVEASDAADFVQRLDVYAEGIGVQISHIS